MYVFSYRGRPGTSDVGHKTSTLTPTTCQKLNIAGSAHFWRSSIWKLSDSKVKVFWTPKSAKVYGSSSQSYGVRTTKHLRKGTVNNKRLDANLAAWSKGCRKYVLGLSPVKLLGGRWAVAGGGSHRRRTVADSRRQPADSG